MLALEVTDSLAIVGLTIMRAIRTIAAVAILWSFGEARSQDLGFPDCVTPSIPEADSVFLALWSSRRTDVELDSILVPALQENVHSIDWAGFLAHVSSVYGVRNVAISLLRLAREENLVYAGDPVQRGRAAMAYGVLSAQEPDSAPSLALMAMLLDQTLSDELRRGVVLGLSQVKQSPAGLVDALSSVVCQTSWHLRPFVRNPSEIRSFAPGNRLHWHYTAVRLLDDAVTVLALTPGSREAIEQQLRMETNPFIADQIRIWAAEAKKRE